MNPRALHVVIRADLLPGQRAAQAVHAAAAFLLSQPSMADAWGNGTVVLLAARDTAHLRAIRSELRQDGGNTTELFMEDGYGPVPEATAFAVYPFAHQDTYRALRKLPLLG